MAESVNSQIADTLTERLLQVGRVTTGLRLEVWRELRRLESDIIGLLKVADPTDLPLLRARRQQVETLMAEEIDPLIQERYAALAALLTAALVRLSRQEAGIVQGIVNDATGAATLPELPSVRMLRAGVTQTLIPTPQRPTDLSATGSEWWTRQGQNLSMRIRDSLRVSVSLEESLTQMTARIRGTSDNAFTDGIMAKARADAATLVQTQVTNAVGESHVAVAARNAAPQLIIIHTSVLDSRTGLVCLGRHGLRYTADAEHTPVGHDIPYLNGVPYHPSCVPGGTQVLTHEGWIAIEDVEVGMRVLSHHGNWCPVVQTMRQRNKSGILRRIHTDTGRVLLATEEHPILAAGIGWLRIAQVQIGDQCFEYAPNTAQVQAFGMTCAQGYGMPEQYPSNIEQCLCTNGIMDDTFSPAMSLPINFQSDFMGRKGKIHDIDPYGILKDQSWNSVGIEHGQQHLFPCIRISPQIVCTTGTHADHRIIVCGRIGCCHALAMSLEEGAGLFTQAIAPVLFTSWSSFSPFFSCVKGPQAIHARAYSNAMMLAPPVEQCLCDAMMLLNSTQGSPLFPMFFGNDLFQKCFVSQVDCHSMSPFMTSTIISIAEVSHNDYVYNLAIDNDESYVANGIVVHNCRSSFQPGLRTGGPIPEPSVDAWLRRRDTAYQDAVLGSTRAKMWRAGTLRSRDLIDSITGRPLTLEELGA